MMSLWLRALRVRFPARATLRTSVAVGVLAVVAVFLPARTQLAEAGVEPSSGTPVLGWQELTNPPSFDPGAMFLLTDGTVMVQDLGASAGGSPNWWRLTPDSTGSYVDGTWSQVASLPPSYPPHAYAAAVLPDGRLVIEGGEQLNRVSTWSNLGAIYDPVANTWTAVAPPNGGTGDWAKIGDAPSVVLADNRWLLGDSGSDTTADAIFDPSTLTWTTTSGPGKIIGNAEAGFTLIPSGEVLSPDVLPPACTTRSAEILDPATLEWSSAGLTPAPLVNCGDLSEIGPQILTYGGKVFVEGATSATALYDVKTRTWSAGPTFPVIGGQQYDGQDSGAALLPDGNVLVALNSGPIGEPPTHFFLFDGTGFTQVADNATSSIPNGSNTYMLLLPTGQVLYNPGLGGTGMEVFTDPGAPNPVDAPQITIYPYKLAAGVTYQIVGRQFNGLSEGAAFGDDYQDSTDYPLVQLTNTGSGAVTYARTWSMTNRSIAPDAPSCTNFMLPSGIAAGVYDLSVIANGIASAPVSVTIGAGGSSQHACPNYTLSLAKAGNGSGTVTSAQAGIACGSTCSHSYPYGTVVTLTAAPATGSRLAGWSGGGCSGTNRCISTTSSNTSVTATFSLVPETLSVSRKGDGRGAVTSSPAGITCGSSCGHDYDYGSSVTLSASAAKGSAFAGWAGACSGKASCLLKLTAARSVTATFFKDCTVPKLKGKRLKAAKRALKAHDCSVGKIKHAYSTTVTKGHVISEKPRPHRQLKHRAKINLVVSKGKKP
jgi:hypothetical protein